MLRRLLAFLALATLPGAAEAAWIQAETAHYIVYSQGSEQELRETATRLEKLDLTQRIMTGTNRPASSIKIKVYAVPSFSAVQATMPFPAEGVAGYYSANTRGPYAVISRSDGASDFSSQLVLFHELTHHFMFQYFNAAYPTWYVEGFAEFIGATQMRPNNVVVVGELSRNRYETLERFEWMPVREIVAAKRYADVDNVYMLYAEGWLLTHYLTLGGERDGQLTRYLAAINAGKSFADAATLAFGDLRKLDADLRAYARKPRLPSRTINFKQFPPFDVTITRVPPAQDALMMYDLRLSSGMTPSQAARLAGEVRTAVTRMPADPFALRILTEMSRVAGDVPGMAAAAARWHAAAPADPLALYYTGAAGVEALKAARSTDQAAWTAARQPIVAAVKAAPKDPVILRGYYDSYRAQGVLPPDEAQNALFDALDLLPQDDSLRYALAADFEKRGLYADAITTIGPAAFMSDEGRKPGDEAKAAKEREKYRLAGEDVETETAAAMLARLKAKVDAGKAPGTAKPTTGS